MTSIIEAPSSSPDARAEAERQLVAAVARHREVLASMQETGRPESSQHVAVKAVGRAVHLVSFALEHATDCGIPLERLVELMGWEPDLVSEAVTWAPDPLRPPAPGFVERLVPAGLDPAAVAEAAASAEAMVRLERLTQRILADADACSRAPALVDLHERLDREWQTWRGVAGPRES
ncbi:MAG: hypothetical protein QOE28_2944 [Solirubrobacteraceae bacterium]|nr:hypothetical protein [Solirubrobacteraceae bacterium]